MLQNTEVRSKGSSKKVTQKSQKSLFWCLRRRRKETGSGERIKKERGRNALGVVKVDRGSRRKEGNKFQAKCGELLV